MTEYICAEGLCHNKPFKTNDRTKIEGHIASKHLNYFPYVCGICDDEGSELAAPTLKHLQTHSKKFHPDKTQKTKLCLDDDKDEELEEWIERVKQHSEEYSEIQAFFTSSSVANSTCGQHCETPSDTTVSNHTPPQPQPSLNNHSLSPEVQFPTPNTQATENVLFHPENIPITENVSFRPQNVPIIGDIFPPETIHIAENASFPAQSSDSTQNVNFQPENSANERNVENIISVNEAIIANTPPIQIERQNGLLQLPEDSILERFLKQEQISNPEPVEEIVSSDSPGFVVSEDLNASGSSFPEMTSPPKPKEAETPLVDSAKSSNHKHSTKLSLSENKTNRVICQLCQLSVQPSYKQNHITVHHLDVPYYYCLYCKYETRTSITLDRHLKTKHWGRSQSGATKKVMNSQIEKLMDECFGDGQPDTERKPVKHGKAGGPTTYLMLEREDSAIQIYCKLCAEYIASDLAETHIIPLHMNGNNAFCCNYCHNLFGSLTRFDNHHYEVHPSQPLDLEQKTLTYDEVYQTCFSMNVSEQQEKSTSKSSPKQTSSSTIECKICNIEIYKEPQRAHVISNHLTGNYYHVCSYCPFSSLASSHIWEHQQTRHRTLPQKLRENKAFENEILKQMGKCFENQPQLAEAVQNHCPSMEKAVESKQISVSESSAQPTKIFELPRKQGRPRKSVKCHQQSNVFESISNRSGDQSISSEQLTVESPGNQPTIHSIPELDQDQTLAVHSLRVSESSVRPINISELPRKRGRPRKSVKQSNVFESTGNWSGDVTNSRSSEKLNVKSPGDQQTIHPVPELEQHQTLAGHSLPVAESSEDIANVLVRSTLSSVASRKRVLSESLEQPVTRKSRRRPSDVFKLSTSDSGSPFYTEPSEESPVRQSPRKMSVKPIGYASSRPHVDTPSESSEQAVSVSKSLGAAASYQYPALSESGTPTTITKFKKDSKKCLECWQVVRADSLKIHVIGHHLNEPYFHCHLCAFTSKWEFNLNTHRRKKHPGYAKKLKINSKMDNEITEMMAKCFDGQPLIQREVKTFVSTSTPLQPHRGSQNSIPPTLPALRQSTFMKRQFYSPKSFDDDKEKVDNRLECLKCGKKVKDVPNSLKTHVMAYHVDGDCYTCGHCSFTARWHSTVHRHCSLKHPSLELVVKSKEKELSHTIEEMQQKCFKKKIDKHDFSVKSKHILNVCSHNNNQNLPSFGKGTATAQDAIENQLASLTGSPSFLPSSPGGTPATNRRRNFTLPIIPGSSPQKFPKFGSVDSTKYIICQVCHSQVRINGKQMHIASHHLEEKSFACPCCDYTSKYYNNCLDHIKRIHNGMKVPINLIKTDTELGCKAMELQLKCFGGSGRRPRIKSISNLLTSKAKNVLERKPVLDRLGKLQTITCHLCKKSLLPGMQSNHARNHLDEQFFSCPYCNCKFRLQPNVYVHIRAKHPQLPRKVVTAHGLKNAMEQKMAECFKMDKDSALLEKGQKDSNTTGVITMDYSMNSSNDSIKSPPPISLATTVVFFCKKCNQSTSKPKEHAWGHLEPTPDHLPCQCTFMECPYEALSPTAITEHAAIQHHVGTQAIQYFIHIDYNMLDMFNEIVSQCFG